MATSQNLIRYGYFMMLLLLSLTMACSKKTATSNTAPIPPGAVPVTVIDYHELDGCEYLLQLENGQKLQPVNLPDRYKKAGTILYITFKKHDGMSICMAGQMVTLLDIVEAKPEKQK